MADLMILADDLTGAADCAARCRNAGLPATIFLKPPTRALTLGATAFTTDSRHLPAKTAAQQVKDVTSNLVTTSGVTWYKKIDSTLRGNIGAEIDAMLESLQAPYAVIAPAFPAQNRGLIDGRLVAPSAAQDGTDLPTLLAAHSRHPILSVRLDDVRSEALPTRLAQARHHRSALLAVDAQTDADLLAIFRAAQEVLPEAVFCGSAGLVGVMAGELEVERRESAVGSRAKTSPVASSQAEKLAGPTLVIVGSGSEMAHRQIEAFRRNQGSGVVEVALDMAVEDVVSGLRPEESSWLLHQPKPGPGAVLDGPDARQRAAHLAEVALGMMSRIQPRRLVLVGGDTAVAVLSRMQIDRLTVETELLPGIPLCSAKTAEGETFAVVLKPGSFGDERTLLLLLENRA